MDFNSVASSRPCTHGQISWICQERIKRKESWANQHRENLECHEKYVDLKTALIAALVAYHTFSLLHMFCFCLAPASASHKESETESEDETSDRKYFILL